MKNLFLAMSRDRKFVKKVQLLRTLANAEHSVSIKELIESVDLTPSTIRTEIHTLNDELKPYIEIHSPKIGEYLLTFKSNTSIEAIVAELIKDSLTFKIVESILHNQMLNLLDALDYFCVSRSTLLRTVKTMNEALTRFNISIETSSIRFKGKEEDIRVFFFEFFALLGDTLVVSDDSNEDAGRFLDLVSELIPIPLHYNYFRISIWLSIAKIRWENGCYLKTSFPHLESMAEKSPLFPRFGMIFQQLHHEAGSDYALPPEEVTWSFITTLHCLSYKTPDNFAQAPYDYRYINCEQQPAIRQEIRTLIHKVMPDIDPSKDIFLKIEGFLINNHLLSSLSHNYEITTADYREYLKENYERYYKKWFYYLTNAIEESRVLAFRQVEDLATCLVSLLISEGKVEKVRPLRVLFAIQGHAGFDEYILERAKLYCTKNIVADFYVNRPITVEEIEEAGIDLVVTNYNTFSYKVLPFHYIHLSTIPTTLDWRILKQLLDSLTKESLDAQIELDTL